MLIEKYVTRVQCEPSKSSLQLVMISTYLKSYLTLNYFIQKHYILVQNQSEIPVHRLSVSSTHSDSNASMQHKSSLICHAFKIHTSLMTPCQFSTPTKQHQILTVLSHHENSPGGNISKFVMYDTVYGLTQCLINEMIQCFSLGMFAY